MPETKKVGLATGLVAAILVYQVTALPDPTLTVPFRLFRLKVAIPLPVSQADKLAGAVAGCGTMFSMTATGWEVQPFWVIVAKTVVGPEVKALGFGIALVAAILVYQVTVPPVPLFTIPLTLVRLNVACPPPALQADMLVAIPTGAGVTVSVMATGAALHPDAPITTA